MQRAQRDFVGKLLFRNGPRKPKRKKKKKRKERKKFARNFSPRFRSKTPLASRHNSIHSSYDAPPSSTLSIIRLHPSYDHSIDETNRSVSRSRRGTRWSVPSATQTVFENSVVVRTKKKKGEKEEERTKKSI